MYYTNDQNYEKKGILNRRNSFMTVYWILMHVVIKTI